MKKRYCTSHTLTEMWEKGLDEGVFQVGFHKRVFQKFCRVINVLYVQYYYTNSLH